MAFPLRTAAKVRQRFLYGNTKLLLRYQLVNEFSLSFLINFSHIQIQYLYYSNGGYGNAGFDKYKREL
ncbi:hypothetical protein [Labilibaculum sp.]|uniref:hypothetical protein n=1 Tax=Labilibaculum sp. TaxID=2060723 RepID=UPI003569B4B0